MTLRDRHLDGLSQARGTFAFVTHDPTGRCPTRTRLQRLVHESELLAPRVRQRLHAGLEVLLRRVQEVFLRTDRGLRTEGGWWVDWQVGQACVIEKGRNGLFGAAVGMAVAAAFVMTGKMGPAWCERDTEGAGYAVATAATNAAL